MVQYNAVQKKYDKVLKKYDKVSTIIQQNNARQTQQLAFYRTYSIQYTLCTPYIHHETRQDKRRQTTKEQKTRQDKTREEKTNGKIIRNTNHKTKYNYNIT